MGLRTRDRQQAIEAIYLAPVGLRTRDRQQAIEAILSGSFGPQGPGTGGLLSDSGLGSITRNHKDPFELETQQ